LTRHEIAERDAGGKAARARWLQSDASAAACLSFSFGAMRIPASILGSIATGGLTGILWSLFLSFYGDRSFEVFLESLIAGIITGVLLSLALYLPLAVSNWWVTLLLGIVALPVGAFCFGNCIWFADKAIGVASDYSDGDPGPFIVGFLFALGSVFTRLSFVLFPLAVGNVFLLRIAARWKPSVPKEAL
jgi:hypothetical protein